MFSSGILSYPLKLCPVCEWLEMFDCPKKTLRFMSQRRDQLRDETTQENFGLWSK